MNGPVHESGFTWATPRLKFEAGAADEIGFDLRQVGLSHVLLVTEPGVTATGLPDTAARSVRLTGGDVVMHAEARVEPTDACFRAAVAANTGRDDDGFLAVGGGTVIDTAKAVDLILSCSGDVLDDVNQPIGAGEAPSGPLKPQVARPATAGRRAESTAVCVCDLVDLNAGVLAVVPALRHNRTRVTFNRTFEAVSLASLRKNFVGADVGILVSSDETSHATSLDEVWVPPLTGVMWLLEDRVVAARQDES